MPALSHKARFAYEWRCVPYGVAKWQGTARAARWVALPDDDHAPLIEQKTQFATNNPAVIGEAFAADLRSSPDAS